MATPTVSDDRLSGVTTSSAVYSVLIKIILGTQSEADLINGKIDPSVASQMQKDFGFDNLVKAIVSFSDSSISSKFPLDYILSTIPSEMVDPANFFATLLGLTNAESTPKLVFKDFNSLMGWAKANLASLNSGNGFKWWDKSTLITKGVKTSASVSNLLTFAKDDSYTMASDSSAMHTSTAAAHNVPSSMTYADAQTGTALLKDVKSLSSVILTIADFKSVFGYQVLVVSNIDVSQIRAQYSAATLPSLVAFLKTASSDSSINVNSKFDLISGAIPTGSSNKFTAFKVFNALGFTFSDVIANSDGVAAVFDSIDSAKDADSVFSGAFSRLTLAERLTRNDNPSTPLAVALQFVTSEVWVMVATTLNANRAKITGILPKFTLKTKGQLGLSEAEYTALAKPIDVELSILSVVLSVSNLVNSKILPTVGGDKDYSLNGILASKPLESRGDLLASVFGLKTLSADGVTTSSLLQLVSELPTSVIVSVSSVFPTLSKANVSIVLSKIANITPAQVLSFLISGEENKTNAEAIKAVQNLGLESVLGATPGRWSNNQNPLMLYVVGAFASRASMEMYLPMILNALTDGVGEGDLGASAVQAKFKDLFLGKKIPLPADTNGDPVLSMQSLVSLESPISKAYAAYQGATIGFAFLYYAIVNDLSVDIIVGVGSLPLLESDGVGDVAKKVLFSNVSLDNIDIKRLFPLLQAIGAPRLHASFPIDTVTDGALKEFWPLAFFDEAHWVEFVAAIGGFANNEKIFSVLCYHVLGKKINLVTGIYDKEDTLRVAVPLALLTTAQEGYIAQSDSQIEGFLAVVANNARRTLMM